MFNNKNSIPPITIDQIMSRENPFISYMDACRSKYGSEIFPIDRYAEVFKIADNVWALYYSIPAGHVNNWGYLIEGPEKAVLIDNGQGVGNHKGLCEMLIPGKEILCAVTHYHMDHTGGCCQWDEVYCHEYTADVLNYQRENGMGYHFGRFEDNGVPAGLFPDEDIPAPHDYKCIPLKNHDVINLGGDYDIEIIHTGGHAPGLSCFLDKKGRRLYSGDAIFESLSDGLGIGLDLRSKEYLPHGEYLDVYYLYDQLKLLADRDDEYDFVGAGHGAMDSDKRVVSDLRDAIAAVMEDPYAYTRPVTTIFGDAFIMQRGIANCRYADPATVLEVPEANRK